MRLFVMPCWKTTAGQPPAGLAAHFEVAFGIVTRRGTVTSATLSGDGLNIVRLAPPAGAVQYFVSTEVESFALAGGVR